MVVQYKSEDIIRAVVYALVKAIHQAVYDLLHEMRSDMWPLVNTITEHCFA